ncbi:MAG: hypothetical protein WCQ23_06045 [Candidatus Methanomethylophilaceae archaeon]|jgi:hypothetical protein
MMEFTLSRVALIACGAILLAAVIVPVNGIYDSMEEENMTEVSDSIASMLDSFWDSETDTMHLRGWDILPGADYGLVLDGHKVIITGGEKDYLSLTEHSTGYFELTYNDIVDIVRENDSLTITIQ